MVPVVHSGDPEKESPTDEEQVQKLPDGEDRVDFIWNEATNLGMDNLYVNSTMPTNIASAYGYLQASAKPNKWFTEGPYSLNSYPTPVYIVKSSAYINEYLKDGQTKDLITGEMSSRNFTITEDNFNSYLYDEYSKTYIDLPIKQTNTTVEDTIYVSANNECVSGTLYCYEMTQTIINSADDPGKIRKNQVKLELEI